MSRNIFANTMKTNNILKIVIGLVSTALLATCVPEIYAESCQKVLDTISKRMEGHLLIQRYTPQTKGKRTFLQK